MLNDVICDDVLTQCTRFAKQTMNKINNQLFYSRIKEILQTIYTFILNKKETGLVTNIYEQGRTCVITLYFNKTVFIHAISLNVQKGLE